MAIKKNTSDHGNRHMAHHADPHVHLCDLALEALERLLYPQERCLICQSVFLLVDLRNTVSDSNTHAHERLGVMLIFVVVCMCKYTQS